MGYIRLLSVYMHSCMQKSGTRNKTQRADQAPPSLPLIGRYREPMTEYLANQPGWFLEKPPGFLQGIYHIGSRC